MKQLFLLVLLCTSTTAWAQDAADKKFQEEAAKAKDTSAALGWKLGSIAGLNLSQVSFRDWAAGGDNSVAYGLWATGGAVQTGEHTRWLNSIKANFGQARVGDQEMRKTDDELYLESVLIYMLGSTINPYGSFTMRTQFFPSYAYFNDKPKVQISEFFDPAYLTQSAGVAFTPTPIITTRLGVGVREVLSSTYGYANDPGTLEFEKSRVQGGMESITDLKWPFAENMVFTSRLEMFAPFTQLDRVIVRNDNTIAAKVNQYITVNFNVQLVNDANVSPKTQIKQALALGLSYTLL
jgi:hypothetical protein